MPGIDVLDSAIDHHDSGNGTPLVVLHGNPASSHIWRNVLPRVGRGHLLAPDLSGMGRSGKPAIGYTFAGHARYLDAWFDALGLDRVILAGNDWGGALAFDWAARHPGRLLGVAFCEAIVKPMAWEELSPQARARGQAIRAPGAETLVLGQDTFIRQAFTGGGALTPVSDHDMNTCLAPYPDPDSRHPILAWARQMPPGGEPAGIVARIEACDAWLADSSGIPKLLMTFDGSPTLLITSQMAGWCAASIAARDIVPCGTAGHHAPEDRPEEIAAAISAWADRHNLR